ncbi:MAG TPA: glycosyltransferase family 4 protein [Gemmatimonadales bacterium]|nr:glycosyltransferase family 4 protein [Gemmatimonadales bacterium]
MRVVYVVPHATRGGAERVTMDLLALHGREAVEPVAIFLSEGPLVDEARRLGVPAEVLAAPRMRNLLAANRAKRRLARRLVELRAELVHGVMAWGHAYGGAAARLARIPAVWFQHDVPDFHHLVSLVAALTPARRIIANSVLTASAQRRFNPRRARIEVVHPGTRIPAEPRAVRRARGRKGLGFGEQEFLVGMVARLARGKGHATLLRAAQSLCHARGDARVIVAGGAQFGLDADYPGELQRLAASLGIADRVRFTGQTEATVDALSAVDVAVHVPDGPESYGLAVVEAMAAGTAVVAGDAGAVREIVEPGTTAVLVPTGDHEALATALLALHDDPALRDRIAAAGAEAAGARFDAGRMARRIEAIYRDAVA